MCYIRWTPRTVLPVTLPMWYTYWTPDTVCFVSLLMCYMSWTHPLFFPSLIMCYTYWTPDTLPTVSLVTRVTLDEDILLPLSDVLYSLYTIYCSLCHSCYVLHFINTIYSFFYQSCNLLHSIHCVMFLLQDVSHHGNPFLYIQNTKVCARTWVNINFQQDKLSYTGS